MSTLSALGKRWTHAAPGEGALELARALDLHPQVASFLWQHGYRDAEMVRAFLEPRLQSLGDPFLLTDLKPAAERILKAIGAREKMVIFGDYDVDGITSSALLWRVLRKLGADVETFLPLRMEEGYGLSQDPPCSSPSTAAPRPRRRSRGCASRASTWSSSITTHCRPICLSRTRW